MKLTSKREKNQQAKDASTLILDLPAFRMMRDKTNAVYKLSTLLYRPKPTKASTDVFGSREKVLQGGDKWNERSQGKRVVVGIWGTGFYSPFLPFG